MIKCVAKCHNGQIEFFHIKRHRQKNIYLKVKDDGVFLSSPVSLCCKTAKELVCQRQQWILQKQKEVQQQKSLKQNNAINLEEVVLDFVEKYAKLMKVTPKSIKFKQYKKRFGSCDMDNNITFNTELSYYPIDIIEYIVVHELAHIKYKDHSREFYDFIGIVMPDYKQRLDVIRGR
jgi:predicted metal-dependent hydrolase